ncbi:HNH endonuclease [Paeniglutamicibacter terrestris]|uniref:HNH endonuclease n=1 Tax=Paeniglutamicibacter terrestris TaxID=2723403 RepID=A0ABX1G4Z6_9MICC|nr:HNH endonuclease signature motif containing protein [Paeniglutamicibacter terrestris]NKG21094.1 HNH endonuclease [Paeniglutamicibacter terrestris]
MATSRTGTAQWKKVVRQAKYEAQQAGIYRCPLCGVVLDYDDCTRPNGASGDHIIPHSHGGKDTISNCRIICLHCNESRGNRDKPKKQEFHAPIRNSGRWL